MLLDVLKKELKRVFTDRRLVFSTFILPALSIYIIYTIMGNMIGDMSENIKKHTSIIYVSNAPESFKNYFEGIKNNYEVNVTFGNFTLGEFENDIKEGNIDLYIEFEDKFDEKVNNYLNYYKLPEIYTFYNNAEEYSSVARDKFVNGILNDYENSLLINRYGNINFVKAFEVDITNNKSVITNEKKASSSFLSMIFPMLLAIILFSGAMGIGMDSIAGEKERGTMATLLLTPVDREVIALGKVISLGIVSIISAIATFIAIIASLPNMAGSFGSDTISVTNISFSFVQYLQLFVIMITLVGIYVGLICLISIRARTVKEAGTYVAPVYMVIMVAAFSSMFSFGKEIALYKFAIPIYGSVTAIKSLFNFELTMTEFLVNTIVSIVVSFILIKMITNAFNDERVMFNA